MFYFTEFDFVFKYFYELIYSIEEFLGARFRDISFITSYGFSWDNKIINIPIEIPTLILMFNRHKQVEYPLVINLLHLLCGSCGNLISKDVLWELGLIILFNSIL